MYNRNVILRYLDSPLRIAFWTIEEGLALILPLSIGLVFGFPITGVLGSVGAYIGLKHINTFCGGGLIKHLLYWYFPGFEKNLKFRIKSSHRRFIG